MAVRLTCPGNAWGNGVEGRVTLPPARSGPRTVLGIASQC